MGAIIDLFDRFVRTDRGRGETRSGTMSPTDAAEAPEWMSGKVLLGEYVIERELGHGSMGTVYLLVRRGMDGSRFAIKTLRPGLLADPETHRSFLQELRTWIDLPEHPNVTACRFFRTVEDRLVIFAEYVDGGSLHQWIAERKLLKLERVLDLATQIAWGLQAVHEQGVIHQDVKPANVLLTADGETAKVTDFSIARSWNMTDTRLRPSTAPRSGLVQCIGWTKEYCSPEQHRGEDLDARTDVWSWGLTVLQMFTGAPRWDEGQKAASALQAYRRSGRQRPYPAMPSSVDRILERCFKDDPAERWPAIEDAAETMRSAYREATGRDYLRERPRPVERRRSGRDASDRRTALGERWRDPQEWLAEALEDARPHSGGSEALASARAGSKQTGLLTDLETFEEARSVFGNAIAAGKERLRESLATLLVQKALVHESLDDHSGAILSYEQAIAIREQLVQEGRSYLRNDLAGAYISKAGTVLVLGQNHEAAELYDRAIAIREQLEREGRTDLRQGLARAYVDKAAAAQRLQRNDEAVRVYDSAIAILQPGSFELAVAYMNKATAMMSLGGTGAVALRTYDRAIEILEGLVAADGQPELRNALAGALMNKACALAEQGENRDAAGILGAAISIFEDLLKEGRAELRSDLGLAYMNSGNALTALKRYEDALSAYDRAIVTLGQLFDEGRTELWGDLAWANVMKANALARVGEIQEARKLATGAVHVLEEELRRRDRPDLRAALDVARSLLDSGRQRGLH